MILTAAFGGYHAEDISDMVNEWIKDYDHRSFAIKDIQFQYSDGYAAAMIIYDTENTLTKLRNIGEHMANTKDLQV